MKIVIIFLIIFGLIFLAVGIGFVTSNRNHKKNCTEKVNAVVIKNIETRSSMDTIGHSSHMTMYSPVFEYKDKTYTSKTGYSTSPPTFQECEETELYIDPMNPKIIFCPKMKAANILSIAFLAFGIAAVIAAVIIFIFTIK